LPVYTDTTLNCRDCRKPFVFTAAEQESYDQKGFTTNPSRCADCRAARKAERERYDALAASASARSDQNAQGGPGPGRRWPRR